MTTVLTALSQPWDGRVTALLEGSRSITVARRCADLADLLAAAGSGLGEVAIVASDLRGLDLSGVARLESQGLRVVGVYPPGDDAGERVLHQWGIRNVAPLDLTVQQWEELLAASQSGSSQSGRAASGAEDQFDGPQDPFTLGQPGSWAGPESTPFDAASAGASGSSGSSGMAWSPATGSPDEGLPNSALGSGPTHPGQIIAVWGPTGAPGRTTVAVNLAAELAARGQSILLVDADTYAASVSQTLSLLDEAPGIAAACRAADLGSLDVAGLARLTPVVAPNLRVMTGLPRADRWPEVRAAALSRVLEVARSLVQCLVIDMGFCLEEDEELSYDTLAPRRNEAALAVLDAVQPTDRLLVVGSADPVSLQRLVRAIQEVTSRAAPTPDVVVNRVRSSAIGTRPEARIRDALTRFARIDRMSFLPDDPSALDAALLAGRSVIETGRAGSFAVAIGRLADELTLTTATGADDGRRRRARGRFARR